LVLFYIAERQADKEALITQRRRTNIMTRFFLVSQLPEHKSDGEGEGKRLKSNTARKVWKKDGGKKKENNKRQR